MIAIVKSIEGYREAKRGQKALIKSDAAAITRFLNSKTGYRLFQSAVAALPTVRKTYLGDDVANGSAALCHLSFGENRAFCGALK
ncbi:hypothetical protein OUZ56_003886 [Daphnia magna]|uniref:Reverse transcriptase RNase H-like domain-containing protein n=1 Tax=Daphnia magna TaxID=35525 RepID=A0ABQ9YN43_9CRUS|nr:hypothetical protein OUZ56_003886 [Daphnia magna]